jgi:glycosyltransferase involved in cell wall biosynthesis
VTLLVFNPFTNDSRVLNAAQSLVDHGDDVTVLAVALGDEPASRLRNGGRVVRLPFDPLYRRLWDGRESLLRPWRHPRDVAATVTGGVRGRRPIRAVAAAATFVVVGIPWLAFTATYHALALVAWRVRRRLGLAPGKRRGTWLEERYKRLLFLAPHAVRVATWSRHVLEAHRTASLEPADVWHANDFETLPAALRLRSRYGGRVVYDSHEIWTEMPGPSGMGAFRRWLLARTEARMARSADGRVTVNAPLAEELMRRWSSERPVVIRSLPPRWNAPDGFESPLRAALEAAGVSRDRRVVLYHGNVEPGRGVDALVEACAGITDVALAFLGHGSLVAGLAERAESDEWRGRLAVLPMVPPDDVIAWVAGADFSACLIEPTTTSLRLASPNKLFQAIAAGVPVLASDSGPIREDVERYGVGVTCDPTDPGAVGDAVRRLLGLSPDEYAALRSAARRAHVEELNWEREAERLVALYDDLAPVDRAAALTP